MGNNLEKIGQNSIMDNFVKTDDVISPIRSFSRQCLEKLKSCCRGLSMQYYCRLKIKQLKNRKSKIDSSCSR